MKFKDFMIEILPAIPALVTIFMLIFFLTDGMVSLMEFVAIVGWGLFSFICIYMRSKLLKIERDHIIEKIRIFNDSTEALNRANTAMREFLGYHGELDDGVSIYSKMLGKGNSVSVANVVTAFVGSLEVSDSIFLVKASHSKGTWSVYLCGEPIHIDVVKWLLTRMQAECEDISHKGTSIIWSSKNVHN